jgi:hypothetical protein
MSRTIAALYDTIVHAHDAVTALVGFGVEQDDAHVYSEAVRRGASLVLVRAAEVDVSEAVAILERHAPVDIEKRSAHWRTAGWQHFDEQAQPYTPSQLATEHDSYPDEVRP